MSDARKQSRSTDSYSLFLGALDVINDAMTSLRDKPVIKDLMSLMDKQASGKTFGVEIYTDNPDTPHDYYTIRVNNQRLELVSRGKDAPAIDWKVSTEYLQDINDHPQKYVDNPLKLDIDWLKHRLSDAA